MHTYVTLQLTVEIPIDFMTNTIGRHRPSVHTTEQGGVRGRGPRAGVLREGAGAGVECLALPAPDPHAAAGGGARLRNRCRGALLFGGSLPAQIKRC